MPRSRSLGISAPQGKDVHEVYLRVKSRPSVLGKISNVLGSMNVDILGVHGWVSDDKKTADLVFYVEMAGSTAPIGKVVSELRRQDYVLQARSEPRGRVYFEGMTFPLTSGGHYRVFVLGADSWAVLVRSLLRKFGTGGRVILQEEGTALGQELVTRIGFRFPSPDAPVLVENLKALFSASGLGILEIGAVEKGERMAVRIREPVISTSKDEGAVDDLLVGVVRGAMGKIYVKDYAVKDATYRDGAVSFELVEA